MDTGTLKGRDEAFRMGHSLAGPRGMRRWQESHCKAIKGVMLLICFLFIKKKKKKKATNKAVSQDPTCN